MRFYVVFDGDLSNEIFQDFKYDERATCIQNLLQCKSPVIKFFKRMHLSKKINEHLHLPLKQILSGVLHDVSFDSNSSTDQWIIFFNGGIFPLNEKDLQKLKKKFNVHLVLFMADPWLSKNAEIARKCVSSVNFDYIFTFDENDSQKNGFIYEYVPYSKHEMIAEQIYDLYFIGSNSGRLPIICAIDTCSKMKDKSIKFLFQVSGTEKKSQVPSDSIEYINKNIEYNKVLQYVASSNCILEIIKNGQSGATLRYYEAVCYNKKLLTNNKNVVNLPFYNPDYIRVFENPEDIDWAWVKERIPVDYHYDGRFSPTHLIDKIIELEEEKERQQNAEKETP